MTEPRKPRWKTGIQVFALVCILMATVLSLSWSFTVGDALVECDGMWWRPLNDIGPSEWNVFTEQQGPCDGFDSLTSFGFVAGYWEFQFAVFRGWRPGGLNHHNL